MKILVDISLGTLGHGGIPQDSRLLWKTISEIKDFQATGMINSMPRKILSRPKTEGGISVALSQCLNDSPRLGIPALEKVLSRVRHANSILLPNDKKLYKIPKENAFAIWSSIFEKSLDGSDLEKVLKSDFTLARISNWQKQIRSIRPLIPVKLDTSNFDISIFQMETYVGVSRNTKKILRFHDLIPLRNPQFFKSSGSAQLQLNGITRSKKDSFFACNSAETQRQLIAYFPELESRSTVIPYTVSGSYWPEKSPKVIPQILNRRNVHPEKNLIWKINEDYIIAVSTLEPRKNYPKLIQAWEGLGANAPRLVIVANNGWKSDESLQAMKPHILSGRLVHLMNLTPEELRIMYSSALGLAFVSFDEGFGFTPIEAMKCAVPTLVSDIPAHREVMGDASLYCNPNSVDSIRDGLIQISKLGSKRQGIIDKGLKQSQIYSDSRNIDLWANYIEEVKNY
jgi:glycosyltransferase involved in cell wall biosynthesis